MAKTAFALSIMRNMAGASHRCLFFSLEMGDVALTTRMISDEIWRPNRRLSYWQISSGKMREERFQEVVDAGRRLAELPIRIEQQPGLTIAQIGARARQYKRRFGLKALFVDHLGLIKPSGRYAGNKVYETGEATMSLKALAKELGIPIFLLAQINRGVEQRDDKRPGLSDLRNSGDIEQDADTVMMLYREAYYLARKEPLAGSAEFIIWSDAMEKVQNRLDVGIEKQRSGPVGNVRLFVDIASNAVRDEISEMDDSLMLPGERAEDFA
jgi:replicative DNA helicase